MKLIFDFIGICVSLVFAYIIKFKLAQLSTILLQYQIGDIYHHAQIEPYVQSLWLINLVIIVCFMVYRGYSPTVGVLPGVDEIIKVIKSVTLAMMLILMINFFIHVIPESRSVFFYFWGISIVILSMFRLLIIRFETYCYARGLGARRSLIIGASTLGQDIAERMILYPIMGFKYVGFLDDAPPEKIHYHLKKIFKLMGSVDAYKDVCVQHSIDSIFITNRDMPQKHLRDLMDYAKEHDIQVNLLSDPYLGSPFVQGGVFDGLPMLTTIRRGDRIASKFIKRLFDILFSFLGLVCLFPVFICIMCWIKLVSPSGSIIYRQERVGQGGKLFDMLKFRSMVPDAEIQSGPIMVDESGDLRYIKGGQFLRQFSLDELPQLWNVLIGEMSIVGPRPERPFFVDEFSKYVPFFNDRHVVPVGITGWAQVNGRSVLTRRPEHKIKYDIYYINHWSLLLDLKICLKTFSVVFKREESY